MYLAPEEEQNERDGMGDVRTKDLESSTQNERTSHKPGK